MLSPEHFIKLINNNFLNIINNNFNAIKFLKLQNYIFCRIKDRGADGMLYISVYSILDSFNG